MGHVWQIQEAKNKFSEVIDEALKNGPQIITKRGVETAIVLSYADYRKILLNQQTLSEFFGASPLAGLDIDLKRDTGEARDDVQL